MIAMSFLLGGADVGEVGMTVSTSRMSGVDITVLIADDFPFIRHVVKEALARKLPVQRTLDAADGVRALLELGVVFVRPMDPTGDIPPLRNIRTMPSPVDLVITDFKMPGASGLHILKMIRTGMAGVARDTPVIMLSAYSDQHLLAAALALDVDSFVTKPVAVGSLRQRILQALAQRPQLKTSLQYGLVPLPKMDVSTELVDLNKERLEGVRLRRLAEQRAGKRPNEASSHNNEPIPLDQVAPGSFLAADVVTAEGRVLLTKGSSLTESVISRLCELSELTGIDHVQVEVTPATNQSPKAKTASAR